MKGWGHYFYPNTFCLRQHSRYPGGTSIQRFSYTNIILGTRTWRVHGINPAKACPHPPQPRENADLEPGRPPASKHPNFGARHMGRQPGPTTWRTRSHSPRSTYWHRTLCPTLFAERPRQPQTLAWPVTTPRWPPSGMAPFTLHSQSSQQLPPQVAPAHTNPCVCAKPRPCSQPLPHSASPQRPTPRRGNCQGTLAISHGRARVDECISSCHTRILGLLGGCHTSHAPPSSSSSCRHATHAGQSCPSPTEHTGSTLGPPNNSRAWVGRHHLAPAGRTPTTNPTRQFVRRADTTWMATTGSHHFQQRSTHRAVPHPGPSKPSHAGLTSRALRQQSLHNNPIYRRDNLPRPPLSHPPASQTPASTALHRTILSVPSHSWSIWRPPFSLRSGRGAARPSSATGTCRRTGVPRSWRPGHNAHAPGQPQHPSSPAGRRPNHRSHREWTSALAWFPTCNRHNPRLTVDQCRPATSQGGWIRGRSIAHSPANQGKNIPRTGCFQPMPAGRLGARGWGALEHGNRWVPPPAGTTQGKRRPSPVAASNRHFTGESLVCHPHACCYACLCGIPVVPTGRWGNPRGRGPSPTWVTARPTGRRTHPQSTSGEVRAQFDFGLCSGSSVDFAHLETGQYKNSPLTPKSFWGTRCGPTAVKRSVKKKKKHKSQ